MKKYTALFVQLLFSVSGCVPLGEPITGTDTTTSKPTPEYYAQRTLRYEDYIYADFIKSVLCYAATGTAEEILTAPITPIDQSVPVVLEFDDLSGIQKRYTVKLVHCNANWTPSSLADIQFSTGFNEFYITDIRPSGNTKVPYHHYRVAVPPVKISGNYIIAVTGEDGAYVVTRRMMVHENLVAVNLRPGLSSGVGERYTMQQLDLDIRYPKLELVNPTQEVKVVLRQNQRWDNAKTGLTPTFVHDAQRRLEYSFFDMRNNFPGLNEFRVFDMRSLRYTGFNVAQVNREVNPTEVTLQTQSSRAKEVYSKYPDINGQYIFDNHEYGSGATEGDYVWVNFAVKAESEAPGAVYVFGKLSDWKLMNEFKLTYNLEKQLYTGRALLKQGYYNYNLALKPASGPVNERYFENSFYDTENFYDAMVYYRPPGSRADLLISYSSVVLHGNIR